MSDISALQKEALAFRDARDWAQFHNAKDLAAGLSIEAGELLEQFLWKQSQDADPAKVRARWSAGYAKYLTPKPTLALVAR